jgi:hypothetical protein
MNLLATAYTSDGPPKELHAAFWVIYSIAAATAFIGIVMRMQKGWPPGTERKLAVAVILIGLVPLAWHLHIYRIDYVPYYQDGTPASPAIWKAMAFPALPVLCGFVLLLFRRRRKSADGRGLVRQSTKPNPQDSGRA